MARRGQAVAQGRQRRQNSCRQFNHPAHQIHTPHLLGDAMLHLQPGIHFKEVEPGGVAVVDELHRARAAVVDRFAQLNRRLTQRIRHALRQIGRRGLLQHLLVTPLYGAVAHAEGDHLPLAVAEELDFEMTRPLNVFLDKDACIAEVVFPQPHHRVEGLKEFRRGIADTHPYPASAGGAFQHHRVADLLRRLQRRVHIRQQFGAFQHRHTMFFRQGAGSMFQAKEAQLLRRRADKSNARRFAGLGKGGVL